MHCNWQSHAPNNGKSCLPINLIENGYSWGPFACNILTSSIQFPFQWTLDGFPLPNNDRLMIGQYVTISGDVISHVNISAVKTEDGGEYECTARSRAGQNSHSARLNIYGMPYVRSMSPISAVAGKLLQIKCPVAGYPIDKIIWEKSECGYTFRYRMNRPLIGLWFPFFPFFSFSPFALPR